MPKYRLLLFTLALILIALVVFVRLPWVLLPYPDVDQAEAVYHALKLKSGAVLYRDSVTHHHPGAIILSLLAVMVSSGDHLITNYLSIVLLSLSAFLFLMLSGPNGSLSGRFCAALLLGIAFIPADIPFYPQHVLLPLITVLLILDLGRTEKTLAGNLIYGLILGLAVVADQRALCFLLPASLNLKTKNTGFQRSVFCLSGFILPLAVFYSYLFLNDAIEAYFTQTLIFPLFQRTSGRSLSESLGIILSLHKILIYNLGVFVALAGGGVLQALGKHNPRELLRIAAWSLALFACASLGQQRFENYLIVWLPLLAFLALQFFNFISSRLRVAPIVCLLLVAIGSIDTLNFPIGQLLHHNSIFLPPLTPVAERAGNYVKSKLGPDDDLYLWGYRPEFYLYAGRLSRFRQLNQLEIVGANFEYVGNKGVKAVLQGEAFLEFRKYLESSRPRYLVIYDNEYNWKSVPERVLCCYYNDRSPNYELSRFLLDQLASRYELEAIVAAESPSEFQPERFWIFRER